MTTKLYKRVLTDDVVNKIGRYYTGKKRFERALQDDIAAEHLYVVTLETDERRARALKAQVPPVGRWHQRRDAPRPYTDVGFEFTELNHIMNHMMARIYGSKWREPARIAQLPVGAFFIDFSGSRVCKKAPPLSEIKGIHLHGFIGFPPSHIERAHDVMPTLIRDISAKHPLLFNKYEIARFDPTRVARELNGRSALENLIEYCLKGTTHLMADNDRRGADMWTGELYRLYPNPNGETYGYPRPPVGSAERRVPFE